MAQNYLKSIGRDQVLKALEEFDPQDYWGFFEQNGANRKRDARDYVVVYNNNFVPAKFLMAVAQKYFNGIVASPNDFSGGVSSGTVGHRLRELGFDVIKLSSQEENFENRDAREKRLIRVRKQQSEFRRRLISEVKQCEISGCDVVEALEACHIVGCAQDGSYCTDNAILLRRDLHSIFDSNILKISPENFEVKIDQSCTYYHKIFHGVIISRKTISQKSLKARYSVGE